MEVRRETLQRAFGSGGKGLLASRAAAPSPSEDSNAKGATANGSGASPAPPSATVAAGITDITHTIRLEEQIEALQTEIIDMQRAIIKVQTWFRMRASAFQGICMREVLEARRRAADAEGRLWEEREASEQRLDALQHQLRGTQSDLEVSAALLAKSSADLTHALASNKRLLGWKVSAQPRMAALQTRIADVTRNREAWLEWVNSKRGLLQRVSDVLLNVHLAKAQPKQPLQQPTTAPHPHPQQQQQAPPVFAARQDAAAGARAGPGTPKKAIMFSDAAAPARPQQQLLQVRLADEQELFVQAGGGAEAPVEELEAEVRHGGEGRNVRG